MADASPKARNHHRAGLKQFIQWSVRNDYLPTSNRLLEADSMRTEHANNGDVGIYTAKEFRALLETAEGPLQPLIAIAGFCGLRTAELLRLEWEDVWRCEGHVEISQTKSKTRSRRLVAICPALAEWLRSYRNCSGKLWQGGNRCFHKQYAEVCDRAEVSRKPNGLRHSFCTFHFVLHGNENLTAAQAGNSPAMIHQHYKGLATKAEAEKWFAVSNRQRAEEHHSICGKITAMKSQNRFAETSTKSQTGSEAVFVAHGTANRRLLQSFSLVGVPNWQAAG